MARVDGICRSRATVRAAKHSEAKCMAIASTKLKGELWPSHAHKAGRIRTEFDSKEITQHLNRIRFMHKRANYTLFVFWWHPFHGNQQLWSHAELLACACERPINLLLCAWPCCVGARMHSAVCDNECAAVSCGLTKHRTQMAIVMR